MNTFAKRLRSQLDVLGKTTQWLADQSGVSRQAVAQWLEGKTEGARGDAILRAARALSCDPYWLLLGEEADAQGGIRFSRSGAHAANEREHLDEYAFVPRLSVSAGMGPGQELHSEQITDALAFRKAYLEIMGLHAHQALCIRCKGDSMAPTLSDGGVALINMTQRRGDGVFAISRPGVGEEHELVVKRITARMDGGLLISSDNPDKARYPDEVIPPGYDLEAMHIIGRVVWFGGNVY
jgi:phage repressor protein C with HTH and peptisase S24 domain